MKHRCQFRYKETNEVSDPFLDAVIEGSIEYDDFWDAYIWFRPHFKRARWYWPFKRYSFIAGILRNCPFCGDVLYPLTDLDQERIYES